MSNLKNLNENEFSNEVLNSELPVIVDFWAEWCAPCKMLTPILEELSKEMSSHVSFVKVNLDENQDLAMKYSIRSIPSLLIFKEGKHVDTKVGLSSKEDLESWILNLSYDLRENLRLMEKYMLDKYCFHRVLTFS